MFWGFRPALPLTGDSDPGGYVRGVYVRQYLNMSAEFCLVTKIKYQSVGDNVLKTVA